MITKPRHLIQGTSYGSISLHWDAALMSLGLEMADNEVELWRTKLAREEGIYVGYSAAANVCAAVKLLTSGRLKKNATVVTVLCDTGLKY